MVRNNAQKGEFIVGYYCYVSKSINSEMVPMPSQLVSNARGKIKKFKEENPEYEELFDCIEKEYDYRKVRPCVLEFEKIE